MGPKKLVIDKSDNKGGASSWRYNTPGTKLCPYCFQTFRGPIFVDHLVLCRNRNPENLEEFVICPHDYSHHVRTGDFQVHLDACEVRANIIMQEVRAGHGHIDDRIKELQEKLNNLQPELERRKRQAVIDEKDGGA